VAIEDPVTLTPNQEPNYSVFQKPIATPVRPLGTIRGYVLDMDGVLYHGERVRAGTIAFVNYLNRNGIPYVCLTNNASRTRDQYAEKLERLGIPIGGEHVIGAAQATAEWLAERAPDGARMLVVGEQGLRDELTRVGFTLVESAPADYVVVGIDFNLTYAKLKEAALALRQRATFIGTNPDLTYPSEEGIVPGNGSQLAYLQAATGKTPTLVGKPSAAMMQVALAHLNLPAAQVAMVGDRLDTDILGGKTVGMSTILLRGGVTTATELAASDIQPDYVMDDLAALLEELERA
jgi:4-nitrophenyl phosphatase